MLETRYGATRKDETMTLIHSETRDGFDIAFYALPEDIDPRDCFDDAIEAEYDTFGKIERGELAWFCAKVTASRDGVELGCDYLGACCYESCAAFVSEDGYYPDMVAEAIEQAKATLARLRDCPQA
jgi:hypothetical protein